MKSQSPPHIEGAYTNYRGELSIRRIVPLRLWFGSNQWHTEPQWLLDGFDLDKQEERTFALKDLQTTGCCLQVKGGV